MRRCSPTCVRWPRRSHRSSIAWVRSGRRVPTSTTWDSRTGSGVARKSSAPRRSGTSRSSLPARCRVGSSTSDAAGARCCRSSRRPVTMPSASTSTRTWSRSVVREGSTRWSTTGSTSCRSVADDSLKGIFCAQVVEHLITPELEQLIVLAHEKLQSGGVLVIETINPRSSYALGNHFYADTSHVRPVHPETLRFICEQVGFVSVELEERSPHPLLGTEQRSAGRSGGRGGRGPARERVRPPGLRGRRHQVIRVAGQSTSSIRGPLSGTRSPIRCSICSGSCASSDTSPRSSPSTSPRASRTASTRSTATDGSGDRSPPAPPFDGVRGLRRGHRPAQRHRHRVPQRHARSGTSRANRSVVTFGSDASS